MQLLLSNTEPRKLMVQKSKNEKKANRLCKLVRIIPWQNAIFKLARVFLQSIEKYII